MSPSTEKKKKLCTVCNTWILANGHASHVKACTRKHGLRLTPISVKPIRDSGRKSSRKDGGKKLAETPSQTSKPTTAVAAETPKSSMPSTSNSPVPKKRKDDRKQQNYFLSKNKNVLKVKLEEQEVKARVKAEKLKRYIAKLERAMKKVEEVKSESPLLDEESEMHIFKCEVCGKEFWNSKVCKRHESMHRRCKTAKRRLPQKKMKRLRCYVCGGLFLYISGWKNHVMKCIRSNDQRAYSTFVSKSIKLEKWFERYKNHSAFMNLSQQKVENSSTETVDLTKNSSSNHYCDFCDDSFEKVEDLDSHVVTNHCSEVVTLLI